jgi:hypothetical protein
VKVLLITAGVFMAVTTTAYWLLGRAIATMDDWVNEPDPDDEEWFITDPQWDDWDEPEYD